MEYRKLSQAEVIESREKHGKNELPPPVRDPWYIVLLDKFKDPLIVILLIAAVISGVIGYFEGSMIETIGIISAVAIASGVAFWQDMSSQSKFDALNSLNQASKVKVEREEGIMMIDQREVVVGDILHISQGEEIAADCEVISSINLHVNESSLTGEPETSKGEHGDEHGAYDKMLLLKSSIITQGSTIAKVLTVGVNTEVGKISHSLSLDTDEKTPLTQQLDRLGDLITKGAFGLAVLLMLSLCTTYWFTDGYVGKDTMTIVQDILHFFMVAVTLIVVAVPEGLPMAVVISLSHSMKKLVDDNNLIKKLHACETMGAISTIITDKTGTLTKNKMKVVDSVKLGDLFELSMLVNNSAVIDIHGDAIGNPTDCAILEMYDGCYKPNHSVLRVIPFDSKTKRMVTHIYINGKETIFTKGAFELIINNSHPDTLKWCKDEADKGRRVIASKVTIDGKDTLLGVVSIEDPLRDDVPVAIKECNSAGIKVMMATGDNFATGTEIGKQAGISPENINARCKPEDKVELVNSERRKGNVVALIGDGVNDAAAMKNAQVAVSVGSGSAVAKEASDVVLMDDSFASIVKGIKFGRSLYMNIQKFIMFQCTINIIAVVMVFIGQFAGVAIPLTVTQMLWVNLIMDTLAALALSTTDNNDVMKNNPRNPRDFIISKYMINDMIPKAISYIVILCICLVKLNLTEFFCMFVLLQWWNMFSCKQIGGKHIFNGLFNNKMFIIISLIILVGQYLITEFGGEVFRTEPIGFVRFLELLGLSAIPFFWFEISRYLQHKLNR